MCDYGLSSHTYCKPGKLSRDQADPESTQWVTISSESHTKRANESRNDRQEPLWQANEQTARLAELTATDNELKEAPLRRDVRLLGQLLVMY